MSGITEGMLREAARRTVATESPVVQAVLLFGSRARGDARPDSDWDVAVVMQGPDPGGATSRIDPAGFRNLPGEVNVLGITEATLRARRNSAGHIAAEIARDGRTLAGRKPEIGHLERRPRMKPEQLAEAVKAVLGVVQNLGGDLAFFAAKPDASEFTLERLGVTLAGHSADASEHFAKMAFSRRMGRPPRTHDLHRIADEIDDANTERCLVALIRDLNGRTAMHHQGGYPEVRITARDVKLGLARFRRLLMALEQELADAAGTRELAESAMRELERYRETCRDIAAGFPEGPFPVASEFCREARAAARSLPDVRATFVGGLAVGSSGMRHPFTQLHEAARDGKMEALLRLLSGGSDPSPVAESGLTPLHLAAFRGQGTAARALLDAGADAAACNARGATPLHEATSGGNTDIMEVLLEAGADVHVRDLHGFTPVHEAALRGRAEAVQELLKAGADVTDRDADSSTPLHEGCESGDADTARILLLAGADARTHDLDFRTPLHRAAESGCRGAVAALLEAGAEVGSVDRDGWTPLHDAAASADVGAARALLDAGASRDATTGAGLTPLDIAMGIGGSRGRVMADLLASKKNGVGGGSSQGQRGGPRP